MNRHAFAQFQTPELRPKVDSLDFGNTRAKVPESSHSRELAIHLDEVEDAPGGWVPADLVDNARHILTRGHTNYLIRRHSEELLDSFKHPGQILDVQANEVVSVRRDVCTDEFVMGQR